MPRTPAPYTTGSAVSNFNRRLPSSAEQWTCSVKHRRADHPFPGLPIALWQRQHCSKLKKALCTSQHTLAVGFSRPDLERTTPALSKIRDGHPQTLHKFSPFAVAPVQLKEHDRTLTLGLVANDMGPACRHGSPPCSLMILGTEFRETWYLFRALHTGKQAGP